MACTLVLRTKRHYIGTIHNKQNHPVFTPVSSWMFGDGVADDGAVFVHPPTMGTLKMRTIFNQLICCGWSCVLCRDEDITQCTISYAEDSVELFNTWVKHDNNDVYYTIRGRDTVIGIQCEPNNTTSAWCSTLPRCWWGLRKCVVRVRGSFNELNSTDAADPGKSAPVPTIHHNHQRPPDKKAIPFHTTTISTAISHGIPVVIVLDGRMVRFPWSLW